MILGTVSRLVDEIIPSDHSRYCTSQVIRWTPDHVSIIIATNQRVVAAQRQQRGLVAVTIRGSVLFYSSAI